MSQGILAQVVTYVVQAAFWAAVAFPAVTALFWPWWKHAWGLTVVAFDMAIALALTGPLLVVEFGLVPGSTPGHVFSWIEVFALGAVPLIIVWRGVLVFLTQRRGGRRE